MEDLDMVAGSIPGRQISDIFFCVLTIQLPKEETHPPSKQHARVIANVRLVRSISMSKHLFHHRVKMKKSMCIYPDLMLFPV